MPYRSGMFGDVNKGICDDIASELRYQGHYDKGALEESLQPKEIQEGGSIILSARALSYIEELENGVPPERINKANININELAEWCIRKGLSITRPGAIAMANIIIRKWKKEGKPLETSKEFSLSGDITHAIKTVFDLKDTAYYDKIDTKVFNELDDEFHKIKSGTI